MDERGFGVERRRNLALRSLFDEVYPRIEAFFDPSQTWGGQELTLLAYRAVREAHPELSSAEVQTLLDIARRVHRRRRQAAAAAVA